MNLELLTEIFHWMLVMVTIGAEAEGFGIGSHLLSNCFRIVEITRDTAIRMNSPV